MRKDAFDGEVNEEREQDQFAKFAKMKSWRSCGQGTDSQREETVEEDKWLESKESKESKTWLWKKIYVQSFQKNRKAKVQWKGVDSFDNEIKWKSGCVTGFPTGTQKECILFFEERVSFNGQQTLNQSSKSFTKTNCVT